MRHNVLLSAHPLFLSTLPARGATWERIKSAYAITDFYPRSPRGERPEKLYTAKEVKAISIHAPREGSDSRTPCGVR